MTIYDCMCMCIHMYIQSYTVTYLCYVMINFNDPPMQKLDLLVKL